MSLSVSIQGDKEVIAKLSELRSGMQKRIVEGSGRAALKPVVADVRAHCPNGNGTGTNGRDAHGRFIDGGHMKKAIGTKKAKRTPRDVVVLSVGCRRGFAWTDSNGKQHDPFFYSIPVEYGHAVKNPKTGRVVGYVAPVGMFRSAYERLGVQVVEDFGSELTDRIEEQLK